MVVRALLLPPEIYLPSVSFDVTSTTGILKVSGSALSSRQALKPLYAASPRP